MKDLQQQGVTKLLLAAVSLDIPELNDQEILCFLYTGLNDDVWRQNFLVDYLLV